MPRIKGWIARKELGGEFGRFLATALCFDLGFAMYLFLYSLYLLDLGFTERQLGLVAGAMTLGSMAGTLPMGALANRAGVRRVLLAGFVLTPLICVLRLFVPGEQAQIVLAFATGLTMCHWQVCFSPVTAALTTERNRTFAFSLLISIGIGLGALGGLLGGALPGWLERMNPAFHAAESKRAVLLLCSAIYALGAWPASRLRLTVDGQPRTTVWSFDPFLLRFLPAMALWSLAAGAFLPFATAFFARRVHLSLERIGVVHAAAQMAEVVAILLAPVVFKRCGLVAGIAYTQVATAIALAGLARMHALPAVIVLYLSFTAFHWMGGPGIYSLLMSRVAENARGSASAANSFVTSLCQAGAAAMAGAAYVDFGYAAVFAAIAGIALLAAGLFWALLRERRHSATVPSVAPAQS